MASSDHEMAMNAEVVEAMEIDSHNASLAAEEAALDEELASLTSDFHTLALEAQRAVYQQPLRTQQNLTSQTSHIYKAYNNHGSMIRLSTQLKNFLTSPCSSTDLKIWSADEISHFNSTDPTTTIPSLTPSTFEELCDASDGTITTPSGRKVSYNNDPESTMIVYENEFNPADMKITFPTMLNIPEVFMKSLNNILLLENSSAQAKLRYLVGKYCLPGPGMETGHPHALPLIRLAISSATTSTLSTIFQTAATNDFGLTPESRTLLRQTYTAQNGRANDTEIIWLARSLRVGEDVVREWWEEQDVQRRGEKMFTIWRTAREMERRNWYEQKGMQ